MRIIDDNKKWATFSPAVSYSFKAPDFDYSLMKNSYDYEKLLTIEIPERNLDAIEAFEEQVFNNIRTHGAHHYVMFNEMIDQRYEEQYYQKKHPAVKKAYEHYQLMLKMAQMGEIGDAGH